MAKVCGAGSLIRDVRQKVWTMQPVEEMQEYYRRRAGVYDASMGYEDPETVERLAPVIDVIRRLLQERAVLEIACGPCFWTSQITSVAKSVLATDYNAATLAVARHKPLDWAKVTLQVADAYNLPSFPMTFEAAMAVDWFAHVPRSRFHEFLRGVHGKLAPGSTVVFCDQSPGAHSLTELRDMEGNHLQERALPDGSRYRVIKHFMTDEEFRSILLLYSAEIRINRFPECRRVVVSYRLHGEQCDPANRR
jgi:2-polyprenyl-3-methyl-5-hydroxy-6-metoxy-1,4-benzoquinol methylase